MDIILFFITIITFIVTAIYLFSHQSVEDLKKNIITTLFFVCLPIGSGMAFVSLLNAERLYSVAHEDDTITIVISEDLVLVDGVTTTKKVTKKTSHCIVRITSYIPASSPVTNDSNAIWLDGKCADVIDSQQYTSIIEKLKIKNE